MRARLIELFRCNYQNFVILRSAERDEESNPGEILRPLPFRFAQRQSPQNDKRMGMSLKKLFDIRMRIMLTRVIFILALICLTCFSLSGCTTIYNPATGRNETLLINTANEVALGKDLDLQIQSKMKISTDRDLQERASVIGSRVAGYSDRQDLNYNFKVVEDKELNAFAIPGAYIYVNSGLVNIATDDELACVLAHEIGHVAARHSVKKMQTVMGYNFIMGIALGIANQQALGQATNMVFSLINLGYSRKDELLADKLAVRYAKRAGFNPHGMVTFFEKLKNDVESKSSGKVPVFLSSHPPIEQRIENVNSEIANPT